jgi:hypothetical protein
MIAMLWRGAGMLFGRGFALWVLPSVLKANRGVLVCG